ncbi:hypothetical protein ACIQC9_10810 [Brevundimonas sp. NPDC092305]|uniref:hypothetical protein n=1 Tax=Brevundimonas sp. NPDC092305 TaxID=3363957 RepID=UPI003800B8ED
MRRLALVLSTTAVLALIGCNKPAEHAEEPHGEEVAASAVADPNEATVTMDQAAADAAAAAAAVQSTEAQPEAPVAEAADAQAVPSAPAAPPAAPAH